MTAGSETLIRGCGQTVHFSQNAAEIREGRVSFVEPTDGGYRLQVRTSQGEVPPTAEEICCGGKLIWDRGVRECPLTLRSNEGDHLILCSVCRDKVTAVTAGIGRAEFSPRKVPLRFETPLMNDPVTIEGAKPFRLTAVGFKNPYAVIFPDTVGDCALFDRWKDISRLHLFPHGAEVLFVYLEGEKRLHLRAYHRDGVHRVRGDDVCAALAAAVAVGRCLPDRVVSVPLAKEEVRAVCTKDWHLFLTCPVSDGSA